MAIEIYSFLASPALVTATEKHLVPHLEEVVELALVDFVEEWKFDLSRSQESWENANNQRDEDEGGGTT